LLFFPGIILLIGAENFKSYLFRWNKLHATACFIGGALLVFGGSPWIGILLELFGFVNLFGNFFPLVWRTLRLFGWSLWSMLFGTTLPTSDGANNQQ
jgi:hypothetical protein